MNYTPILRDDFDKSFKYEKQSFLCYSGKKLRELSPDKDYEIVGLARKTDSESDDRLILGNKQMSVFSKDDDNLLYKDIGYIPVSDDNKYIAVQESRLMFLACFGTTIAATAIICGILINNPPVTPPVSSQANLFNPLPPVDKNIEDYVDESIPNKSDGSKKDISKGGGKVSISYKPDAKVTLSTGEVTMEYQNPEVSSHDAIISLYVVSGDESYLIANSGRIPAGKQLKTMKFSADKKIFSGEGKYNAEYRVSYYNPETGEKALTEATIEDITLTVKK